MLRWLISGHSWPPGGGAGDGRRAERFSSVAETCNQAGPYGVLMGQAPPHMSSAVVPLLSAKITVSDAYFPSCFTDAKWRKSTT